MRVVSSVFLQVLPAAENVVLVVWHPQWFLDGVGEAVAREAEVL